MDADLTVKISRLPAVLLTVKDQNESSSLAIPLCTENPKLLSPGNYKKEFVPKLTNEH